MEIEAILVFILICLAFSGSWYFFYDSSKRYRKAVLRLERHLERENLFLYRCQKQLEDAQKRDIEL